MAEIKITKCDICKVEHRSDKPYHWSDCIGRITFDFSSHAGIQGEYKKDVCTGCGKKLLEVLESELKKLSKESE